MNTKLSVSYIETDLEGVQISNKLFWLGVKHTIHNVLVFFLLLSFVFPSLLSYFYLMREQSIPQEFLNWWYAFMAAVAIYFLIRTYRKKNMIVTAFLLMYFFFLISNSIWL
jgi:hypothetical protein